MADVVLVGGGGHARVLLRLVRVLGHVAVGYVAPEPSPAGMALPWFGTDDDLASGVPGAPRVAVMAIGKNSINATRIAVFERLSAAGLEFPALSAPGAIVHEDVALGGGSVILDGAIVVTGTRLGRACIVNTSASVDHDALLGDDVHVAPGAVLCGGVHIGSGTLVGAGATVIPGVRVAGRTVIAAGATVVRDIVEAGVYGGTPARRLR